MFPPTTHQVYHARAPWKHRMPSNLYSRYERTSCKPVVTSCMPSPEPHVAGPASGQAGPSWLLHTAHSGQTTIGTTGRCHHHVMVAVPSDVRLRSASPHHQIQLRGAGIRNINSPSLCPSHNALADITRTPSLQSTSLITVQMPSCILPHNSGWYVAHKSRVCSYTQLLHHPHYVQGRWMVESLIAWVSDH